MIFLPAKTVAKELQFDAPDFKFGLFLGKNEASKIIHKIVLAFRNASLPSAVPRSER
jgi:hypothetical protein